MEKKEMLILIQDMLKEGKPKRDIAKQLELENPELNKFKIAGLFASVTRLLNSQGKIVVEDKVEGTKIKEDIGKIICYVCNKEIKQNQPNISFYDNKRKTTFHRHRSKSCELLLCNKAVKGESSIHPDYKILEVENETGPAGTSKKVHRK